MKMSKWK